MKATGALSAALAILFGVAVAAPINQTVAAAASTSTSGYIVQLRPNITGTSLAAHHAAVRSLVRRRSAGSFSDMTLTNSYSVGQTFTIGDSFTAYVASFDGVSVASVADMDDVLRVEPDGMDFVAADAGTVIERSPAPAAAHAAAIFPRMPANQIDAGWSLGDLSHRAGASTEYAYDDTAGVGMTAFVLDGGIRLSHSDFEGRAVFGYNAMAETEEERRGQTSTNQDDSGHGTHVAGIIAGRRFGVAKNAGVVDVKIMQNDAGRLSWFLAGVQWAVDDIVAKDAQTTSVINLSIAGAGNTVLDDAIGSVYLQGIVVTAAAGNNDQPASLYSPGRSPTAITVGMTGSDRARGVITAGAFGSNYGPELDVFAPGKDVASADYLSDDGGVWRSGTSMAAPLVAGLVCYFRGLDPAGLVSPDAVRERIVALAMRGVVGDAKDSPNLLVYNGSGH